MTTAVRPPTRGILIGALALGPPPDPAPLFGAPGRPLNGAESRALRVSLGLQPRHVADLVNALGLTPEPIRYAYVVNQERSRGAGYAPEVVATLDGMGRAVDRMAVRLASAAGAGPLRRPPGGAEAFALIESELIGAGVVIGPKALATLNATVSDLWPALIDSALVRAAIDARRAGAGPLAIVSGREGA